VAVATNLQPRATEVARWDPFEELEQLQQQLAQIFPPWSRQPARPGSANLPQEFIPLADVEETEDAYTVEIELAGVKKEDIQIEVAGRRLAVTGERKEKERKGTMRRRTRTVGRFRYEVVLPDDVDSEHIEASMNDGVLTVRVPKSAGDRPKQIAVK
jgi:HSP20 family protein